MIDSQDHVLTFWFEETTPPQWFQVNPDFDTLIKERFLDIYEKGRAGILDDWRQDADGCLALCLVLDQFPRNMFRGTPQAFATDSKALVVSKYAVAKGFDQVLPPVKRRFLYLSYEHSENLNDQAKTSFSWGFSFGSGKLYTIDASVKSRKVVGERVNQFDLSLVLPLPSSNG